MIRLVAHVMPAVALAAAGAAAGAAAVHPAARAAVPGAGAVVTNAYTFVPGDTDEPRIPLRVVEGSALVLFNADILDAHTVTSASNDGDGEPLFDSGAPVGMGGAAIVAGVESLSPGMYEFYCASHTYMRGELEVAPVPVWAGRGDGRGE